MPDNPLVLLVLGEPGVDPAESLSVDGLFTHRFFADHEGESRPEPREAAALPAGIVRLASKAGPDAVSEARRRAPGAAILLLNAGERWSPAAPHEPPAAARGAAGGDGSPVDLPLSIRVAGARLRHTPWFRGGRPGWLPGGGGTAPAHPAGEATREPGDLSAILRVLCRDALASRAPREPVGAVRLLIDPSTASLRAMLRGGIRDGFRGILLSSLHGLHRLILLARGWQAWRTDAAGAER